MSANTSPAFGRRTQLAAALAGFGPNEVAVIASGRLTNEELFMARQFAAAVKSEFIDIVPSRV